MTVGVETVKYGKREFQPDLSGSLYPLDTVTPLESVMILNEREENEFRPQERLLS